MSNGSPAESSRGAADLQKTAGSLAPGSNRPPVAWFATHAAALAVAVPLAVSPLRFLLFGRSVADLFPAWALLLAAATVSGIVLIVRVALRRDRGAGARLTAGLLAAVVLPADLIGGGVALLDGGSRITVMPQGPGGCRLVVVERQYLMSGAGDFYVVEPGSVVPERVGSYTADDDALPVAEGRSETTWVNDTATVSLSARLDGSVTPDRVEVSCGRRTFRPVGPDPELTATPPLTPAACGPGVTLTASWSRVEVAGPRRFLSLDVRNCSGSAVALLARPELSALDANGAPVDLHRIEMQSTRNLTLSPAEHAYLNLSWLAGPRCEQGAQQLVVKIPEAAAATSDDCLQLGSDADFPDVRIGWDSEPFR